MFKVGPCTVELEPLFCNVDGAARRRSSPICTTDGLSRWTSDIDIEYVHGNSPHNTAISDERIIGRECPSILQKVFSGRLFLAPDFPSRAHWFNSGSISRFADVALDFIQ